MNGTQPKRSAPLTYVVGIMGALLIVAILVSAMQKYLAPQPLGAARAAERAKFLAELKAKETEFIHNYAWQDQAKGLAAMGPKDRNRAIASSML